MIIGGGVAGVELALAMAHRLRREVPSVTATMTIVEASADILGNVSRGGRAALIKALDRYQIRRKTRVKVTVIREGSIQLDDGEKHPCDFLVSAAGARPHAWLADAGLALTDGYINVGADLRASNDEFIFAAGDCAHLTHDPRPKAGVFAVRQAPVLLDNLRAALMGT